MVNLIRYLQTLVVALCIIAAGQALAQVPDDGVVSKPIRVGIYTNYPLVFERGGQPTGFHVELLKAVAKGEGWTLDYHFSGSLKNVLDGLEAGTLDLGVGLVPSDERRRFLDFTNEKNALVTGQLFVMPGRTAIRSMSDLEGKRVAVINQESIGHDFVEACAKLKVTPIVRQVNAYEELVEAVATGAVDAGLFTSLQGQRFVKLYKIRPTPIVFKPIEVQYAVAKGRHSAIIAALDGYLHTWKGTEHSVYHTMEQEFLRELSAKPPQWSRRQVLGAVSLCLLLLTFGVILGNHLAADAGNTSSPGAGRGHIRQVMIFIGTITLSFWVMDAVVAWLLFNADLKLDLLQWTLTKVPAENLYVRVMLFLVCCVFGIYIVKYINRSEMVLNILVKRLKCFEQLTNNARDMIFRMALPSGRYEFVSRASSQIFGYAPEEFYKRPLLIKDLVHHDWQEAFSRQWEELLAGNSPPSFECQVITKAGEARWINQRTTLYLDARGVPVALEGIVTDISDQKRSTPAPCEGLPPSPGLGVMPRLR